MNMSQYELQSFKKTERLRIKAGDVEQCLKAVYGVGYRILVLVENCQELVFTKPECRS